MGKGNIISNKIIFMDLFSKDFWFVVPEYQRSYVWQNDNIYNLLDDLLYAYRNKPENEYFLGSLVLKKLEEKNYNIYEVLDGQQRLTTFFLMMACIRDLLTDYEDKKTIGETIYQAKNILKNIPARARITYKIRDKVEEFIENYVVAIDGTTKDKEIMEYCKSDNISLNNMSKAILIMKKELGKLGDEILSFAGFIMQQALFIYVSTDNTEDAFRMFTILNNRGIPLTSADIIKSQNIGELSSDREVKKYAEIWEDIEGRYGEGFDRFIQFIRTILVKEKARANLLDEFNQKIYSKGIISKGKETLDLIYKYSEIFDNIIDLQDASLSNEYKNLITIMKMGFRSEDWIPPVMYYYSKFKYERLGEFLKLLEFKFAGDWICGITPTVRLDAMNEILKAIEKTTLENLQELFENNEIFKVDLENLNIILQGNIYGKQYAKYLLLKIEYLMGDNTVHLSNHKYITVEHVLPQNPKEDSEWVKNFSKEEREYWTNKLANLVLLSKKKNSSLSNLDFKDKKKKYLSGSIDVFNSSKIFLQNNELWNKDILDERQKKILKILISNKY